MLFFVNRVSKVIAAGVDSQWLRMVIASVPGGDLMLMWLGLVRSKKVHLLKFYKTYCYSEIFF